MIDDLRQQFLGRDDAFWGITYDEDTGSSFEGMNFSGTCCTGYAAAIRRRLGDRVRVFGFYGNDNPTAAVNALCDGHDFAVVDGRYIVDPWIIEVEDGNITTHNGQRLTLDRLGVMDMHSPEARTVYGDPARWSRITGAEALADRAAVPA